MAEKEQLLLLFPREKLSLGFSADSISSPFEIAGSIYENMKCFGHYDWLRSRSSNIVGVRYWLLDEGDSSGVCDALLQLSKRHGYSSGSGSEYLEFRFIENVEIDEDRSEDQDLSTNGVFKSNNGEFMLYFDIGAMTDDEKEGVLGHVHASLS